METPLDTRVVRGRELVSIGRMSGGSMYAFTAQGVQYRLIPNVGASYVLRREEGGYRGRFATLDEAVRYADEVDIRDVE